MSEENRVRVLVTGGGGFIGSHLTEALVRRGHWVRVLDNFSTGKRENLAFLESSPNLEIIEADIREQATCHNAMQGMEYVFHQAALPSVQRSVENPQLTNEVNALGTLNLLIAARDNGVRRFLYSHFAKDRNHAP